MAATRPQLFLMGSDLYHSANTTIAIVSLTLSIAIMLVFIVNLIQRHNSPENTLTIAINKVAFTGSGLYN